MTSINEERNRILQMIEAGQVSAAEAARLLDALNADRDRGVERNRSRLVRIRVSDLNSGRQKVNVSIPVGLLNVGLKLGARLGPTDDDEARTQLLRSIEKGVTGRLLEWHDYAEAERIELFVE
jgi:hypothetical protein